MKTIITTLTKLSSMATGYCGYL